MDIKLNGTLCKRYKVHMEKYGKSVLESHSQVLTGSSDIGMASIQRVFDVNTNVSR